MNARGAARGARMCDVPRAGRPAVSTPRAPLRPEPPRRMLGTNLGYRWAYASQSARLSKFQVAEPSRKLCTDVAKMLVCKALTPFILKYTT